jgi:ABC-type nitrate/sulfonate/bicarbonate transport system substrate-binding protein
MYLFSRRWTTAVAAGLLAITTLAACGNDESASSNDGLTKLTLQQYPGALLYTSELIAQKEGIFEDHGLDVKFVNPGDGATSLQLLSNGKDTQGVLSDISAGITAVAKDQPITAVGSVINKSLFQISASNELLKAEGDGDWKSKMQALKGKTVAVPGIGGSAGLVMVGLLRAAGLDPDKDVTLISITTVPAATAQFEQGKIDAFIYIAPGAQQVEKAGVGGLYLDIANDAPPEFSNSVIAMLANKSWANDNPDAVQAWKDAEIEAINWMRDKANRDAAVGYISKNTTGGDVQLAEQMLDFLIDTAYSETADDLAVPTDTVETVIRNLGEGGIIPKGSVTPEDIVAN